MFSDFSELAAPRRSNPTFPASKPSMMSRASAAWHWGPSRYPMPSNFLTHKLCWSIRGSVVIMDLNAASRPIIHEWVTHQWHALCARVEWYNRDIRTCVLHINSIVQSPMIAIPSAQDSLSRYTKPQQLPYKFCFPGSVWEMQVSTRARW